MEPLREEDYLEPSSPFDVCQPIDIRRVQDKLETYLAAGNCTGAGKLLEYWLSDAIAEGDSFGAFVMEGWIARVNDLIVSQKEKMISTEKKT